MLILSQLVVNSHDDLVSVNVDMPLHERHWLSEHIEAGTNEVYIEDLVISYDTEYSLIVVVSSLRVELYDDTSLRMWFNRSLSPRE